MAVKALPSAAYLRECFTYNPKTGALRWRPDRPRKHFRTDRIWRAWLTKWGGKPAGSVERKGHIAVSINGELYKAHRLIWRIQTGRQPRAEIDHWDRNKGNNRWSNLRKATHQQNEWNSPRRKQRALPKGVCARPSGRYQVAVIRNGYRTCLGTFDTPEEARLAYRSFTNRYRGEFQHPD